MNVLLLGGGGREHALAWKLSQSPMLETLFCAPGNPGIAQVATCIDLEIASHRAVVEFCRAQAIGLVVVGPEAPLVAGIADDLARAGIRVFGPSKAAAQLEGSKAFTKALCSELGIPTAAYRQFCNAVDALSYVADHALPIVIKADGLAAGKGVIIAETRKDAIAAVNSCFEGRFGDAGSRVVIEEFLVGEEASFFALCDGKTALPLATAQDHKRVEEGDTGPNTGGMGAYSPAPVMTPEMVNATLDRIIRPTVKGMAERGTPFAGALYAGLMITAEGPKLIEYNVRFGDPECQVLMMRLQSDLLPLLVACCDGHLTDTELDWYKGSALTVVMAANGYPDRPEVGSEIGGPGTIPGSGANDDDVMVFHAGTKRVDGRLVASGGRVLNVTARGPDIRTARDRAYEAVARIDWPGGFYRRDIGWRALEAQ